MSPGPDYSIDMVKQMAFEREIWRMEVNGNMSDDELVAHDYLQKRLNEINEKYKDY